MMDTERERDQSASESTPLLADQDDRSRHYGDEQETESPDTSTPAAAEQKKPRRTRWPTVIALLLLCLSVIAILCLGFALPSIIQEYAQEAVVFEPLAVSIAAFTDTGVRARIQASLVLDASRVKSQHVRNLGRFGTWLGKEIESGNSDVQVYLPEYGNILLGTAAVPPIKVNIRNGLVNNLDFFSDLTPGDIDGIRVVGNDWLGGRLGQLRVKGLATVPVKLGILNLGSQTISESFVLQDRNLPGFPEYNITKLNVHSVKDPDNLTAVAVDVSLSVQNEFPVNLTLPGFTFQVLVPNCNPDDTNILVANATTKPVNIEPKTPVHLSARGLVHEFPDELTNICPGLAASPLDLLVKKYIQGLKTTIYVRGGTPQSPDAPPWVGDVLNNVTVPVPFASHGFSHLIKRFAMTNVHFSLPDPSAQPGTPEAQPHVSSLVKVAVGLPKEMNFPLNISRVRSRPDVYYKGDLLGHIDLQDWQEASARRNETAPVSEPELLVDFDIKNAPLEVVDEDVFTDVLQELIFKQKPLKLNIKATVDAETETPMGVFTIRGIPGSGEIMLKPPFGGGFGGLKPRIHSMMISDTTKSSVKILAQINVTNPTDYSAHIPYVKLRLSHNGTDLAHVQATNLSISPGLNSGLRVECLWDPLTTGGEEGVASGRELLSSYVSGLNATVTLRSFAGTIPSLPELGRALSGFKFDVPVPRLRSPEGDDSDPDDRPHFIKDATLHLWSSTAVFTLASPLPKSTLFVTSVNATAFYEHKEPVGRIDYDIPFAVPPGVSQTPRIPVDLDLGGTGSDALKKALGGTLKLDAVAEIGLRLGEYVDLLFYQGKGIGAKVRI